MGRPTPYPEGSCRRIVRPARPLACPQPTSRWHSGGSSRRSTAAHQSRSRTAASQRLKSGLDVAQLLAVLGGQAALQRHVGRIAMCSAGRRRLVLDHRLPPIGTEPVEQLVGGEGSAMRVGDITSSYGASSLLTALHRPRICLPPASRSSTTISRARALLEQWAAALINQPGEKGVSGATAVHVAGNRPFPRSAMAPQGAEHHLAPRRCSACCGWPVPPP
jgi:hypothetical protein